jgi:hypothetical protein
MIQFQVYVTSMDGSQVAFIRDYIRLEYVLRGDSTAGAFVMEVDQSSYISLFSPNNVDYRVQIYRKVNDLPFLLEGRTEFLINRWDITDTTIIVTGEDLQSILGRRVNAYPVGNSAATFTNIFAGNIMKALVRNNFITPLAGRDVGSMGLNISSYLSVDADTSDGLQMSISCSRDNIYDVIQKIASASQDYGSWICGRIISDGYKWQFFTFPNQFGNNNSNIVFSRQSKNIENIRLEYDRTEEYTAIYTGGQGTDIERIIGSATSSNIDLSPIYRREYFYSNPQIASQDEADYYASALTRLYRGQLRFRAELINSQFFVRGVDYNLGDIITVSFLDLLYTCRIDIISVKINNSQVSEVVELKLV